MSTPASELRKLLKDRAARKAARKTTEAASLDPPLNKEAPGGALSAVPIQAVDPAAVPGSAQYPVIDLETGTVASRSSEKRGLDAIAEEASTGKKRPRTRRAGSADESHGESRLAAKEIPALPALPIRPALLEDGEAVMRDEQSRLIAQTWENGRGWRDETYKALTIRRQVEFAERPVAFSAPQPIVDRLAAETGFRPKLGQDTAPLAEDLLDQVGNTMSNLQLKRYAMIANPDVLFISQALRHQATTREAAKEALARETAQARADREEFDRVKAGLEKALSRKEAEANERAALLEAAAAQSARDREEIQNLTARVRELDSFLREEKTAHEEAHREKEEADGMLEVTFEEAIYMAWRKDKRMNLLVFLDPESKRAEFKAKEKEDAKLLGDEA
ncbi:uncharacterized protein LOC133815425 [Humulus lupulus]|uniref:uncharacterized protein LOC133815425 n=1 Tax=Humulus lupulus TaxID=3486 RepID=UPI002B41263E|nr:uncharacterized protein LOC133815425 [Humulus lupulus]